MNSKIIRLTAENVKRLSVVEITPSGNLVVIGGRNGQGKTSVLDSIMYALGGGESLPSKPVRRGEDKAVVELDLGDLVVRRTFTATGGTQLVVMNKEGVKQTSPQAILDDLVGRLSFDPLAFTGQSAKERSETLRALVGLDFSAKELEKTRIFNERTIVNREAKSLEGQVAGIAAVPDAPNTEQSTASILEEQQQAAKANSDNEAKRRGAGLAVTAVKEAQERVAVQKDDCHYTRNEIARMQSKLTQQEGLLGRYEQEVIDAAEKSAVAQAEVAKLVDVDLAPFRQRLLDVETSNSKFRKNKLRAEFVDKLRVKAKESDDLTKKLDAIDKEKRNAITAAKYPVEGLSIGETGDVLFNGLPFEQGSTAEQLRVSVAIGLALNSKLRVLLVRRGSDLDEESLKMVADMAATAGAQIWLERVGEDGATSVVIEDGHVKASAVAELNQAELVTTP